jgi:hypothetical protein
MLAVPFKANAARRHRIPRRRHRVTNWAAYDAALRQRGSLTVLYRAHEVLTAGGSQGKLVRERSRPGSARSAFHAAQAASTTAA